MVSKNTIKNQYNTTKMLGNLEIFKPDGVKRCFQMACSSAISGTPELDHLSI
jgi:hypothetical protein